MTTNANKVKNTENATATKRVYCLYRVSTAGQVDKDDIPMQRQACREFAARQGWEIIKEFTEKGVSGFKVSAKDRDAVQEIQRAATLKSFDILLIFMFDRLGRRDDETPFVVEWFVQNGIEVWSTQEGEQRFDNHVDKLMNYIRYWQASGESIKTGIRTKTRLDQIVKEGCFRGGTAPLGYRLTKEGRFNKKNHELYEISIDEQEAEVVRTIFYLYTQKGYGSQRICTYLTEHGILTRSGRNYVNCTIQGILRNEAYLGILKNGDVRSPVIPKLQLIDQHTFDLAQEIITQRSADHKDSHIPLNTKGSTLLSGNIFCGHCGARLVLSTCGKKYKRKDGEVTITPKVRYRCYNRARHPGGCDGQSGYTASKLDAELLNNLYHESKQKVETQMDIVKRFERELAEVEQRSAATEQDLSDLVTWADMYRYCDLDEKKMILGLLFKRIVVSRDYDLDIEMTVTYEQYFHLINQEKSPDEKTA